MPIDHVPVADFKSFCEFFRVDGTLRYAYIFDLPPKRWQPILRELHKLCARATYFKDNVEQEYPHSYEEIFGSAPDGCFDWVQYEFPDFSLAFYCWYPTVLTMTADPRELQGSERKPQKLLDVSRSLAELAELPMVWSIDNWPPVASLRILPHGHIEEVQYRLFPNTSHQNAAATEC